MLDIKTLEGWLWEAACKIRGDVDAPKYKDYILPLIFLKRLSDVFDDEVNKLGDDYGDKEVAEKLVEEDHSLVWFYLPEKSRWTNIAKQSTKLGEFLTDAVRSIAKENPKLQGVINIVDFNATTAGQRVISDDKLKALIDTLGKHRLGLKDVEPDIIGRAYEYLIRKFAEGSGQSAGEFYTPREVAILMSYILDPKEGEEFYDPCLTRPLVGDASASLCKSLVAMPVKRVPCLFCFDYNGAPEQSTPELPFVALGIGQPIADPFLAFLKRLLWKGTRPTLGEGRLAAVWAIDHVRLTNPGGVGGPIQLATLSAKEGKQPTIAILSEKDVQEHIQQVRAAEGALVNEFRPPTQEGEIVSLPEAPKKSTA